MSRLFYSRRGFTLLEMTIVAAFLFILIPLLVHELLFQSRDAQSLSNGATTQYAGMKMSEQFRADVRSGQSFSISSAGKQLKIGLGQEEITYRVVEGYLLRVNKKSEEWQGPHIEQIHFEWAQAQAMQSGVLRARWLCSPISGQSSLDAPPVWIILDTAPKINAPSISTDGAKP